MSIMLEKYKRRKLWSTEGLVREGKATRKSTGMIYPVHETEDKKKGVGNISIDRLRE